MGGLWVGALARNYHITCPVLAGSGVCDQRLDAELLAMESTWQPLVSLPAGWEQLCSTQTPSGSALPLAPCLPHTSPSASSCPQQDQDPRTPLQEPPEVSRGPSSCPLCVSTQGEEIWLYFHSQGTRSLAAGAIGGTRTAPCSRSSPAEARG